MTLTMERQRLHDAAGNRYTVEIIRTRGHYEIRLDGEFYATAESIAEAEEEIFDITKVYCLA